MTFLFGKDRVYQSLRLLLSVGITNVSNEANDTFNTLRRQCPKLLEGFLPENINTKITKDGVLGDGPSKDIHAWNARVLREKGDMKMEIPKIALSRVGVAHPFCQTLRNAYAAHYGIPCIVNLGKRVERKNSVAFTSR